MSKKKNIIISIFSLALCVVLTFAWINEVQNPSGRVMTLTLKKSFIGDSEIDLRFSVMNDETEEFDILYDDFDTNEDAEPDAIHPFANFAPGCRRKFRIDIHNNSDEVVRLRMIFTDIICDSTELQENIVIGTNGFTGFTATNPAPSVQNIRLVDGIDESGSFMLLDSVEISSHKEGEFVSIYFYVMFTSTASENLEGMEFSIGTLNFLTI